MSDWRQLPVSEIRDFVSPSCAVLLGKLEKIGAVLGNLQDQIDKWDAVAKGESYSPPGLPVVYVREIRAAISRVAKPNPVKQ